MIVDLSNPVEYKAEEKRQRDAVLKIENWWIRRRNKKIFLLLKEGICAAERTLSYQVLRKISPTEADLLNDPALATRVRFRFGGDDYPPRILFKIFTNIKSCGNSIHYLSGKKYIKPGSQAAIDAGKQMGNRRLMEQLIVDTCQQQGGRVTNDSDVTNLKELVQYRACLDETPAYLGGKDNTWRELDLKILPRHHVMHDVSLYVTRGVVTANLKYSFPKYWPHSPCQKVKQIRSLMNIRYKEQIISTEKSRARSSRRSAVQRAKMMRELYLDGERKQITTPEYSERNQLTTSPDSEIDIMQDPEGWNDDDDDDDEALSLYEWTQTLPVDVADLLSTQLETNTTSPSPSPYSTFQDIAEITRNCTDVLSQLRLTELYSEYKNVIDTQNELKIEPNLDECPYLHQCKHSLSDRQLTKLLKKINIQVKNETSLTFDRLLSEAKQKQTSKTDPPNIDFLLVKYSTTSLQLFNPTTTDCTDTLTDQLQLEGTGTADTEPDHNKAYANCVKRVPRAAKQLMTSRYIILNNCRKVASLCAKEARRQAQRSLKLSRDSIARARRLMREANICWRRYERVEREARRKADREALEQRKMEEERKEAKRQQRKLNFLITQTELYAHFVSGKKAARIKSESGVDTEEHTHTESDSILRQLDEAPESNADPLDSYSSETAKKQALDVVREAIERDKEREELCTAALQDTPILENTETAEQPEMFQGELKSYQLKGMRWLAGLYSQGINGILADEMGLGKTIQTLALLAHLAEKENIWGPFLVVSPAGTLYNWQQECERFVPKFKVLPYWGNAQDRRTTRQYMSKKHLLSCSDSPFHILITSYQLAVKDCGYLHRITWQYMVLDEAQAIKSSASQRWQVLLGFKCRNRLLLTGTPIQNSMAELWALLHFIMPSIFDSHDEFKEWFSKDIESHAEGKSAALDKDQLSRLHLILKPFMLRRVKKDVEHEMAEKIEVNLECELTLRQRILYQGLKNKLSLDEIFQHSNLSRGSTSTCLLNIVMQFRKVCNHPELFDRRDVSSPFVCEEREYFISRQLYYYSAEEERFSLYKRNLLNIHSPINIHNPTVCNGILSLLFLLSLSMFQWYKLWNGDYLEQLRVLEQFKIKILLLLHYQTWCEDSNKNQIICPYNFHKIQSIQTPYNLPSLTFTVINSVYGFEYNFTIQRLEPRLFPRLLSLQTCYKAVSSQISLYASTRRAELDRILQFNGGGIEKIHFFKEGALEQTSCQFDSLSSNKRGLHSIYPLNGWSNITIPDKEVLITDSGKMRVLDILLAKLKTEGHRVLIYSQMTKVIDLLVEYMIYRKYRYIRLDGSCRISDRRDMVDDFQNKSDIFVFLLSTRAGGLGINLTAADTVIFYDSDWNPTVDQQAMDRAHRLGQTRQVTVYRLITKGTIDERILQRAREKSEIQHMVISGGEFKMDQLKPKEMASLLLDSEEIESKLLAKQQERREQEERTKEKKRKYKHSLPPSKRVKLDSSLQASSSRASSPSINNSSSLLTNK